MTNLNTRCSAKKEQQVNEGFIYNKINVRTHNLHVNRRTDCAKRNHYEASVQQLCFAGLLYAMPPAIGKSRIFGSHRFNPAYTSHAHRCKLLADIIPLPANFQLPYLYSLNITFTVYDKLRLLPKYQPNVLPTVICTVHKTLISKKQLNTCNSVSHFFGLIIQLKLFDVLQLNCRSRKS